MRTAVIFLPLLILSAESLFSQDISMPAEKVIDKIRGCRNDSEELRESTHVEQFSDPLGKNVWMSETSGYTESWDEPEGSSGTFSLGLDIMTALMHGNINAWIWWQGSELDGIDEYTAPARQPQKTVH